MNIVCSTVCGHTKTAQINTFVYVLLRKYRYSMVTIQTTALLRSLNDSQYTTG